MLGAQARLLAEALMLHDEWLMAEVLQWWAVLEQDVLQQRELGGWHRRVDGRLARPTDERLHYPEATPRLVHQTGLQQWLVCCAAQRLHYQEQDELVNPRDARGE